MNRALSLSLLLAALSASPGSAHAAAPRCVVHLLNAYLDDEFCQALTLALRELDREAFERDVCGRSRRFFLEREGGRVSFQRSAGARFRTLPEAPPCEWQTSARPGRN